MKMDEQGPHKTAKIIRAVGKACTTIFKPTPSLTEGREPLTALKSQIQNTQAVSYTHLRAHET